MPDRPSPIPLDKNKTQHLAWLLGAKTTVVAFANLAGIPEARESRWEIEAIANRLQVAPPSDSESLAKTTSTIAAVVQLIRQARPCVEELQERYGPDHAALMEISLKTNALLILYDRKPELAGPVRKSVLAAKARTDLPADAFDSLLAVLDGKATADEVHAAVHSTHRTIERLLREGG